MLKQSGDCCLAAAAMTASYLPATQDSIALASKAEDPFEAISILHKIPETPSSSPDALRVLRDYKDQLEKDPTVCNHLSSRYEALVELNLCGYVEPFSRVEISHIARLINLPVHLVEKRLTLLSIKILMLEILESLNGPTGYLFVHIFETPP
ncbi:26S PROTEASOME NON-ATPASE REGULATORY SUBUNIT 11-LIKE PROTEIN [Salix koriyanagi]|uniref:26S PROTEASOME NON-ATPASE REGULATORY SUBUNIT 11-LIKE PROTEIN n=1 Tax=Salix koriyanagi TaxID=2511006 RepID=A0A9Q0ZSM1_9ROSI|nr:26S PROTEASOME NON-ATPASE REGULATORY SUBUNIT 11-LIKE PROTEIN [Salix koriyanagi]